MSPVTASMLRRARAGLGGRKWPGVSTPSTPAAPGRPARVQDVYVIVVRGGVLQRILQKEVVVGDLLCCEVSCLVQPLVFFIL